MLQAKLFPCVVILLTCSFAAFAQIYTPAMVCVPGGWFQMGARDDEGGAPREFPRHNVHLSPFELARYETTNREFADVLNWALSRGYLTGSTGAPYTGGKVYAAGKLILSLTAGDCQIYFSGGQFLTKTRGAYSMDDHPVVEVSWWGAVVYCNFLSEINGLATCYDLAAWELRNPVPDGYRLPTEAELERAMSWDDTLDWITLPDGTTGGHWVFGFRSDTIAQNRANYGGPASGIGATPSDTIAQNRANYGFINPLRLPGYPYTTPAGYYDGIWPGTVDSPSPAGCYDLSGNVQEWVHDRFSATWYTHDDQYDPTGPAVGSGRTIRGGTYYEYAPGFYACRGAARMSASESTTNPGTGFRVARGMMSSGNSAPEADAGYDLIAEAQSPNGAAVMLDGSASIDADSTPGTHDDIVSFTWFVGGAEVGEGEQVEVVLPLGSHVVTLVVTDTHNETDEDELLVVVQDTAPPSLFVDVTPDLLWPPNNKLVQITSILTVSDSCDGDVQVGLKSVVVSDAGSTSTFLADSPGGGKDSDVQFSSDGTVLLRAARYGKGGGRTYTLTYEACDASGNMSEAAATVIVPHNSPGVSQQ